MILTTEKMEMIYKYGYLYDLMKTTLFPSEISRLEINTVLKCLFTHKRTFIHSAKRTGHEREEGREGGGGFREGLGCQRSRHTTNALA